MSHLAKKQRIEFFFARPGFAYREKLSSQLVTNGSRSGYDSVTIGKCSVAGSSTASESRKARVEKTPCVHVAMAQDCFLQVRYSVLQFRKNLAQGAPDCAGPVRAAARHKRRAK